MILGIDPGQSGGFAVVGSGLHVVKVFAFTKRTEKDIYDAIKGVVDEVSACYIEAVHSMPGQGVASMFKFGQNYGFLRGCVMACEIPFFEVSPMKWQSVLGCKTGGNKNITKSRAQQWFPGIKVTHAIADALLIAEYGVRQTNPVQFF